MRTVADPESSPEPGQGGGMWIPPMPARQRALLTFFALVAVCAMLAAAWFEYGCLRALLGPGSAFEALALTGVIESVKVGSVFGRHFLHGAEGGLRKGTGLFATYVLTSAAMALSVFYAGVRVSQVTAPNYKPLVDAVYRRNHDKWQEALDAVNKATAPDRRQRVALTEQLTLQEGDTYEKHHSEIAESSGLPTAEGSARVQRGLAYAQSKLLGLKAKIDKDKRHAFEASRLDRVTSLSNRIKAIDDRIGALTSKKSIPADEDDFKKLRENADDTILADVRAGKYEGFQGFSAYNVILYRPLQSLFGTVDPTLYALFGFALTALVILLIELSIVVFIDLGLRTYSRSRVPAPRRPLAENPENEALARKLAVERERVKILQAAIVEKEALINRLEPYHATLDRVHEEILNAGASRS